MTNTATQSYSNDEEVDLRIKWHNESKEDPFLGVDCPICFNRGTIAEADIVGTRKYLVLAKCRCMNQRKANKMLEDSGLGKMIDTYKLENYFLQEPWQFTVKSTATSFIGGAYKAYWFYIGGKVGSGKSHICTAITTEIIKKGNEGIYVRWRDLLHDLKSTINTEDYQATMKYYRRIPVLDRKSVV